MSSALPPYPDRHVGRLRIHAASEGDARRTSILLSDALGTASLPVAEQGTLLVVRRLALGRIPARAGAVSLSLRIEQAMREVRLTAVPYGQPGAQGANAVIFPARAEALMALALRHARGVPTHEWFWTAVVAAWAKPLSRGERWLALLEPIHALPEAALVAARLLEEAVRAGFEDELLSAIPPGLGAEWLRAEGWSTGAPAAAEPLTDGSPVRHAQLLGRWERRWGPDSDRLIWLATLLAVIEQPARAADPHLPAQAAARLVRSSSQSPSGQLAARASDLVPIQDPPSSGPRADGPPERGLTLDGAPTSPAFSDEEAVPTEPRSFNGEPTTGAGLLFLVSVLQRLQFHDFLSASPSLLEEGLPIRLLRLAGTRVGLPPDDPLMLALRPPPPPGLTSPAWELPTAARALLAQPPPRSPIDSPLAAWLTVTRRWCRRRARLGLATLICRPGRVAVTRSQIDIIFALGAADLRLRRIALDVDPGWVPWLGRIVRFHYLEAPDYGS